jgi:Zn-dependent peptidase ImmA (M78 family)
MMKTNNDIAYIANEVLTKYVKRGGVYKVFQEIMKAEGIKFREMQSANSAFVGALTKGNNGQTYIMINGAIDNEGRKHFTIAHELGHYFLLHQLKQNAFYCSKNEIVEEGLWKDPIEQEANYFASCLLMPEEKVRNAFLGMLSRSRKATINDFLHIKNDWSFGIWIPIRDELTKRYGVSEAALRYRLQQLKLAEFEFRR